MLKKILKYTFRTLLVILLVLMLVPALLYIPAVQDFVRGKAVGYASRTLGMDLSVERLRLSFPLRLSVDNTLLSDKGDTLLSCGHLSLDVAVWPLLRKEVAVRSLELAKLAAHYRDSTAGIDLKVAAGQFAVNDCRVGLPAKTVGISRIALTDGDVFLNTAESAPAEKADSAAALPWQIDVGKLTVANLVFGMRTAPAANRPLRPAAGRRGGQLPGSAGQPAGIREKHPAEQGRIRLPDGPGGRRRKGSGQDGCSGQENGLEQNDGPEQSGALRQNSDSGQSGAPR